MEDALEVYERPYDPLRPVVCLDEASKQLIEETRPSLPTRPGDTEKLDHEHHRNGVVDLFMIFEPLAGRRHVEITTSRTRVDFAHCIKNLVDVYYPESERVLLAMDHLNTHEIASLIEGKILLIGMRDIFAFMFNPGFIDLADSLNVLKGRENDQYLSLICTYDKACRFSDKAKTNPYFYNISSDFCYKVPSRIFINTSLTIVFPYNTTQNSIQFMSYESSGTILGQFQNRLREKGYEYISGTSGNFHGQPTVHDLVGAQNLAIEFNKKASELNMGEIEVVVIDIPSDATECITAFPIVSFCNKEAIEIKRLLNKQDKVKTKKIIDEAFKPYKIEIPIIYDLES